MKIDKDLGISNQALAILHLLSDYYLFAYDDENGDASMMTHAWYNGRENGIALSCSSPKGRMVVVFGECRGTDAAFVDVYETRQFAPHSHTDPAYEAGYQNRKTFRNINKAAEFIHKTVEKFVKKSIPTKTS